MTEICFLLIGVVCEFVASGVPSWWWSGISPGDEVDWGGCICCHDCHCCFPFVTLVCLTLTVLFVVIDCELIVVFVCWS